MPVLDRPIVIAGHEIVVIMRPNQRSDGSLMRLQNRLKIERQRAPQGELPVIGPRYQPPSLWGKLKQTEIIWSDIDAGKSAQDLHTATALIELRSLLMDV